MTIAHEGAHGVAALVTGRRLAGIRLHSDTSGLTVSAGRPSGPGMVLTAAAGYTGPALFGLGAAAVLAAGYAVGLLWALLGLLALLLVQIRNWYGLWSVLVTGALVFAATWWLPAEGQAAFAHGVTWFLLLAAPKTVWELQAKRRRRSGAPDSDADQLARLTRGPRPVLGRSLPAGRRRRPGPGHLVAGVLTASRTSVRLRRRGAECGGWCTGATSGSGGILWLTGSEVTVNLVPWCPISSGSSP